MGEILSVDSKSAEFMTCLVKRFHPQVKGQGLYLVIEQMDGPLPSYKGPTLVGFPEMVIFLWIHFGTLTNNSGWQSRPLCRTEL